MLHGNSASGINMINIDNSYTSLDDLSITDNGFGVSLDIPGEITIQ